MLSSKKENNQSSYISQLKIILLKALKNSSITKKLDERKITMSDGAIWTYTQLFEKFIKSEENLIRMIKQYLTNTEFKTSFFLYFTKNLTYYDNGQKKKLHSGPLTKIKNHLRKSCHLDPSLLIQMFLKVFNNHIFSPNHSSKRGVVLNFMLKLFYTMETLHYKTSHLTLGNKNHNRLAFSYNYNPDNNSILFCIQNISDNYIKDSLPLKCFYAINISINMKKGDNENWDTKIHFIYHKEYKKNKQPIEIELLNIIDSMEKKIREEIYSQEDRHFDILNECKDIGWSYSGYSGLTFSTAHVGKDNMARVMKFILSMLPPLKTTLFSWQQTLLSFPDETELLKQNIIQYGKIAKATTIITKNDNGTFSLCGYNNRGSYASVEINFQQSFVMQTDKTGLYQNNSWAFQGGCLDNNIITTINNPKARAPHLEYLQRKDTDYKKELNKLFLRGLHNRKTKKHGGYIYTNTAKHTLMGIDLSISQNSNLLKPCDFIYKLFIQHLKNDSNHINCSLVGGFFRRIDPNYCHTHNIDTIVSSTCQFTM